MRHRRNVERAIFNTFPGVEFKNEKQIKIINWIGKNITSPENRLILGVTALMSQPFIDWNNKRIDENTRKIAVARTIAKIIVGTTTGVIIRRGSINLVNKMSKVAKNGEILPKYKQFFTPKKFLNKIPNEDRFEQYNNIMGTLVGLFVMLFTNFLIDAPLTKLLTNKFIEHGIKNYNTTNEKEVKK